MSDYFIENGKQVIYKDPDSTLDYTADFTAYLAAIADTIMSAVVTVPTGVTLVSTVTSSPTVTAWISGGTVGTDYKVNFRITTNSTPPRVDDRSIYLRIKDK